MAFMEISAFPKENGKKVQDWDYDEEEQVITLKLKGDDYVSDDEVLITSSNFIIPHLLWYWLVW